MSLTRSSLFRCLSLSRSKHLNFSYIIIDYHRFYVAVGNPLSEVEIQILKLIVKNPNISYQSIATNLEKSRVTIGRHIQQLKSRKILQRIGSDKKGYWEVKAS